MEESDNKRLSKIILISLIIIVGCTHLTKPHQRPYNAFGEAIISNEYDTSSDYLNPLKTQNYTIIDNVLSSINSPLFITSQTLASIESPEPIVIDKYDVLADKVIECESGGDHTKIGDTNYYVNGVYTPSVGIAQFQFRTFEWLKGLASMDNLKYENPDHQRWLLKWAIQNNYGHLWSCYKKIL